jgi:hypothetical protein
MVRMMTFQVEQAELKRMVDSPAGNYASKIKIWTPKPSPGGIAINEPDGEDVEAMVGGEEYQVEDDDWRTISLRTYRPEVVLSLACITLPLYRFCFHFRHTYLRRIPTCQC